VDSRPEVFTADYLGTPGHRAFFVQARSGGESYSYVTEKVQVQLLAEKLQEMLVAIDPADTVVSATPERDPALGLEEPIEARWRVGAIGLGYDESDDSILVVLHATDPLADEEVEGEEETGEEARFLLRRDQARAFVLHVNAVVAEGRPLCQLCGLPMDPDGHNCPASNGHRPPG
jgi:uncharacterized repeat protein (TIGR03847 family)